jgi:hypothetical protein
MFKRPADNAQMDADSAVLTAAAFQFLLWNRRVQIWYFIIQLLDYSQVFFVCFFFKNI